MRNKNTFMARKKKYGAHPSTKLNRFRRPLTDEEREKTSGRSKGKPDSGEANRWAAVFRGRDMITTLLRRAGVNAKL